MKETINNEQSVYEIGYLIVSSIQEEKISGEAEAIKSIIIGGGASIIAEEAPHRQHLAYTMSKKTVSGGYDKYDVAYFGWIKFELGSDKIEGLKKSIELHPSILRMLLISTVRENTYLGKHAQALTVVVAGMPDDKIEEISVPKKDITPASIEEMDKSIENMVKEA